MKYRTYLVVKHLGIAIMRTDELSKHLDTNLPFEIGDIITQEDFQNINWTTDTPRQPPFPGFIGTKTVLGLQEDINESLNLTVQTIYIS